MNVAVVYFIIGGLYILLGVAHLQANHGNAAKGPADVQHVDRN